MNIQDNFKAADRVADKTLLSLERSITNRYKQANKDLKSVFAEMYSKYETDGVLTYAEMSKYNRLKAAEAELSTTIKELYAEDKRILSNGLSDTYKDGYYRTAYAIEKEVQAKLSYLPLDTERIKAAVQNPISGLTLDQTLAKNRSAIISKINQEITRSLIRGESYGKMAKSITEVLGGDARKSIVVAQTEAHRVHNQARLESVEHASDIGVDMVKVWVATLDGKTRYSHASLDGKEVPAPDGIFKSINGGAGPAPGMLGMASEDINCRCTFIVRIAGVSNDFRRVRGEGVIPYVDYKTWAKDKGIKGF